MDQWWAQFETVIRNWIRADQASMDAWHAYESTDSYAPLQALANRGQVAAEAPTRTAIWEAFLYQRGHIDAFLRISLPKLRKWAISQPASVGIIDLGCGTGSVAFAFNEIFGDATRLHYVGQDHHRASLRVCRSMIEEWITDQGGTLFLTSTLKDAFDYAIARWPRVARVFVTCSFLLCQDTVTDETVREIAEKISELVDAFSAVRVVVADAPWKSRPATLMDELKRQGLSVERLEDHPPMQYTMRYPSLDGQTFRQNHSSKTVAGFYLVVTP